MKQKTIKTRIITFLILIILVIFSLLFNGYEKSVTNVELTAKEAFEKIFNKIDNSNFFLQGVRTWGSVNDDGKDTQWDVFFYYQTEDGYNYYQIGITSSEIFFHEKVWKYPLEDPLLKNLTEFNLDDWRIDSGEAIKIAQESFGYSIFNQSYPENHIDSITYSKHWETGEYGWDLCFFGRNSNDNSAKVGHDRDYLWIWIDGSDGVIIEDDFGDMISEIIS